MRNENEYRPRGVYGNREGGVRRNFDNNRDERRRDGETPRRRFTRSDAPRYGQSSEERTYGQRLRFSRENGAEQERQHRPQQYNRFNRNSGDGDERRRTYNNGGNRYNNSGNYRPNYRRHDSDFDENAKYSQKKQIEYKKQFMDYNAPMRLNKFLANSGICSRREADEYIKAGVILVNGEIVTELGTKVIPANDKVLFHDQLVRCEKRVYVLLNKPKDCVTTADDPQARLTVLDLVKNACSERIYPVGRLDRNTTGVLLLTNDGDLTSKMTHPKYNQKKIYEVVLDHEISEEDMQKLRDGLDLEDGEIHVDEINYSDEADLRKVGVEIHSGRNRIVRRIFDAIGYKVLRLDRVYFAGLTKKNLPRGKWRHLSEMEVNMLKMSK